MTSTCTTARRTRSMVCIDDLIADGSNQMNAEVYRSTVCAQTQLNVQKLTG